jgi:hypothetical protein
MTMTTTTPTAAERYRAASDALASLSPEAQALVLELDEAVGERLCNIVDRTGEWAHDDGGTVTATTHDTATSLTTFDIVAFLVHQAEVRKAATKVAGWQSDPTFSPWAAACQSEMTEDEVRDYVDAIRRSKVELEREREAWSLRLSLFARDRATAFEAAHRHLRCPSCKKRCPAHNNSIGREKCRTCNHQAYPENTVTVTCTHCDHRFEVEWEPR